MRQFVFVVVVVVFARALLVLPTTHMFERTLESLIKGLRSNRGADEAAFVTTLLDEIRHEVRSGDMDVKAGAVLKLTYVRRGMAGKQGKMCC